MERSDYAERIGREIRYCLTFEEGNTCLGAGERKRRRVCVWCPNYERYRKQQDKKRKREDEQNEKDN